MRPLLVAPTAALSTRTLSYLKRSIYGRLLLAGLGTALATGPVQATDRFVSVAGNDTTNDCGTSSSPCRTIGNALSQAVSGDTIKIASGRYRETVLIDSSTTLTFSGGWTADFSTLDPSTNVSVLDGRGAGVSVVGILAGS